MNKIAIVYHSKYGTTKQYAQWIAEEAGADLFEEGKCKASDLAGYHTIVYGGAIHAGEIMGIQFLKKNIKKLEGKKILAFAVGLNVDSQGIQKECMEINFVKKLEGIPCHFFRGAYNPLQVTGMDKKLMGMVKKMLSGKAPAAMTDEEKELLEAIEHGANFVDRAYISELVRALNA